MKVVINNQYGGFSLSPQAVKLYAKKAGFEVYGYTDDFSKDYVSFESRKIIRADDESWITYWVKKDLGDVTTTEILNKTQWFHDRDIPRDDKILIEVVKELGVEKASGKHATLKIVNIPDGTDYEIEEYDGKEWIAEKHRTWS